MNKTLQLISIVIYFWICSSLLQAKPVDREERWFGYFGVNGSVYSNSDIRFKGSNYDFTLSGAQASDQPNHTLQTNFKVGYFFDKNYSISLGVDQIQYALKADQTVKVDGEISGSNSFDGSYDNDDITLSNAFLDYKYDLNYFNVEHNHSDSFFNKSITNKMEISTHWLIGMGGGLLIPNNNIVLLENKGSNNTHFAGLGANVKAGLSTFVGESFFIQSELKIGYVNMWNIRTTAVESDKASQDFWFTQYNILLGWMI